MPPEHVTVYGNDHSPWVQAVLLGLHDRGIPCTQVTVPPLSVFLASGILMPAAKIDQGPWLHDSAQILAEVGCAKVTDRDARDLMLLFRSSASRRTDSTWRFWSNFSRARDGHPNGPRRHWNHFWRAFSILYFYLLIKVAGSSFRPKAEDAGLVAMQALQERLDERGGFLGGTSPDTADYQLFGLVQMCSSTPVPERGFLQHDPTLHRLRSWIGEMQTRFAAYDHLYSAQDYAPRCPPSPISTATEQIAFWLGSATMWLAFPITIPLVVFYAARTRRRSQPRASA